MKFYKLAIGARFSFRGRHFTKTAMSMARDEQRVGNLFLGRTEVTIEGEVLLLPPEEAARWNPEERMECLVLGKAPPALDPSRRFPGRPVTARPNEVPSISCREGGYA